jgi:hypothetical protein
MTVIGIERILVVLTPAPLGGHHGRLMQRIHGERFVYFGRGPE